MMSDETIQNLDKKIDEYLCHRRFFHLSMKFGETSSVVCEPYKASWLVSIYYKYELNKQERYNTFPEAFQKFQEFCSEALATANDSYRNPKPQKKSAITPIRYLPPKPSKSE